MSSNLRMQVIGVMKTKKNITGYLYVKHNNSCWERLGKIWPEVTIIFSLITVVGSSNYSILELWHNDAKRVLKDLIELLKQDEHVTSVQVIQEDSWGAKIIVSRIATGVLRAAYSTNSLILWPAVIRKGIECYPMLVPDHSNVKKLEELVKRLSSEKTEAWFKITNRDEIFKDYRIQQLLFKLTPAEKNALFTAYELGYFEQPRIHSSDEVAKHLGISRATFLEHLRKAEKKIISSLYRYGYDI